MGTKNEIKEKPQAFMLLWPLDMAIHEFTAVEQRLWWFSPECQASSSLGGTCISDPECLGKLLMEGGGAAASLLLTVPLGRAPRPCGPAPPWRSQEAVRPFGAGPLASQPPPAVAYPHRALGLAGGGGRAWVATQVGPWGPEG